MAAAAIGWYGPLIDLSEASSHIGDYVQLLVFVHKSTPVQYKLSRNGGGGEVIRMDIQVGDDTRHYFPVSIWQKQLGSTVAAGDIVLLQNIKIARFRDVIEGRTLQCSLLQCLVHSKELLASQEVDELMAGCRIGMVAKNKLHKLIEWVKRAGLTNSDVELNSYQSSKQFLINWKTHEEVQSRDGFSLIQLKHLPNASKATFHASVGEIFLPITWRHLPESEAEKMFISRRIYSLGDDNLVDDLICTGCQLCGAPLSSEVGSSIKKKNFPLCQKSYNGLHAISRIYRPFQLYVWDDSNCIPLFVKNKAAEMLFGNIKAEKVYASSQREHGQNVKSSVVHRENHSCEITTCYSHFVERGIASSHKDENERLKEHQVNVEANYHSIWLILLKMLLKRGTNNPLNFNVIVNSVEDWESRRYEVLSVSMSSFGTKASYL